MDLANSVAKNSEPETEISNRIRPARISTFTNGVLKRHAPLQLQHNGHFPVAVAVAYKECLKNHAATIGGHALDGCGEFMPPPPSTPVSLKCAACGCHRNFHRREPEPPANAIPALEFHPHHRHHPPPPQNKGESSPDESPPPISSAYYPSAPHMLLALSHGNNTSVSAAVNAAAAVELNSGSRKRYRTKFSQFQKERMLEFAERVGWRMEKRNDDAMNEFCGEVGVDRAVFKVWMHNNKNIFAKKDQPPPPHLSNDASETSTPPLPSANGNGAAAYHHQYDGSSSFHGEEAEADQLHLLK